MRAREDMDADEPFCFFLRNHFDEAFILACAAGARVSFKWELSGLIGNAAAFGFFLGNAEQTRPPAKCRRHLVSRDS